MNEFADRKGNIEVATGFNPCDAAFVQLCGQLSSCLAISRDNLVKINDEGNGINCLPLSANFGAGTATKIPLIIRDHVNDNTGIDYADMFNTLKFGLQFKLDDHKKREEKKKIFYSPKAMIRHLDFMTEMAGILGENMFDFEGELIVLLGEVGIAAGVNINEVIESNEFGQIGFTPQINQKTRIIITKRAILLKAVEKKPDAIEMPNNDKGMLHHIIIPVKTHLKNCLGGPFPLQGDWLELSRGRPFQRKTQHASDKVVGPGGRGRSSRKRGSRGERGPGRYSEGK